MDLVYDNPDTNTEIWNNHSLKVAHIRKQRAWMCRQMHRIHK